MEVYLNREALKNLTVNGGAGALMYTTGADDADDSVVGRELLVLMGRLAKGVQPGADQVFQTACAYTYKFI